MILQIPCACAECMSMLYQPWIPGLSPQQQVRYQPVTDYTQCIVLGSLNKCNIITLSHKSTTSKVFEYICQVFIDGISDNMYMLVKSGNCGYMNHGTLRIQLLQC